MEEEWDSLDSAAEKNIGSMSRFLEYKKVLRRDDIPWAEAEIILTGFIWDESEEVASE